ncbi:MAG: GntR family transcriptional regulator [Gemmatimonadaceae bacterium]
MQVFSKPETVSGIPVYLQLVEQVKHAIATGTIRAGDQLPGVRRAAEDLLINPNTVVKAYRELEHEGFIEVRHGAGAFVSHSAPSLRRTELIRDAIAIVRTVVAELRERGVTDAEMRRLLESELIRARAADAELRDLVEPDATGIS